MNTADSYMREVQRQREKAAQERRRNYCPDRACGYSWIPRKDGDDVGPFCPHCKTKSFHHNRELQRARRLREAEERRKRAEQQRELEAKQKAQRFFRQMVFVIVSLFVTTVAGGYWMVATSKAAREVREVEQAKQAEQELHRFIVSCAHQVGWGDFEIREIEKRPDRDSDGTITRAYHDHADLYIHSHLIEVLTTAEGQNKFYGHKIPGKKFKRVKE